MSTVHLQFPSLIYLSAFRRYAKATQWKINLDTMTVQCACTSKMLNAAVNDFRATLLTAEVKELQDRAAAVA